MPDETGVGELSSQSSYTADSDGAVPMQPPKTSKLSEAVGKCAWRLGTQPKTNIAKSEMTQHPGRYREPT
jgi:hypothetical protein